MSATPSKRKTNERKQAKGRPREGSVVWAMIQVLDGKRKPMTPVEILTEIQKRGLATKLAGKTPEASVAARLAVHVGIYFERPEKGKYRLMRGITAKSVARPTPSKDSTPKHRAKKPSSTATRGRSDSKPSAPARERATSEPDSEPAAAPPTA